MSSSETSFLTGAVATRMRFLDFSYEHDSKDHAIRQNRE